MNLFYELILCFVSGFTQCFLLGCAIYLFRYHHTFQFQRTFAIVVTLLAIGFINNPLSLLCSDLPRAQFYENILVLFDYVVSGFFFIFAVSLVYPDRFSKGQLLLFAAPFVLAVILYVLTESELFFNLVMVIFPLLSLPVTIIFGISIKRHTAMLRDNLGDLEHFDLRWSAIVIAVLFVVQLIWSIHSLFHYDWFGSSPTKGYILFNTFWCFLTMGYVWFVTHKIANLYVYELPTEPEEEAAAAEQQEEAEKGAPAAPEYYNILSHSDIDNKMATHKYYRDPTLTLQKLAIHLGTNRQYLSSYINKEKKKTFYEYINDYRLEEAKSIFDSWGDTPQQSLEDVASQSGFNSYSTFFRSFVKKYGETPSKYLRNKEQDKESEKVSESK